MPIKLPFFSSIFYLNELPQVRDERINFSCDFVRPDSTLKNDTVVVISLSLSNLFCFIVLKHGAFMMMAGEKKDLSKHRNK